MYFTKIIIALALALFALKSRAQTTAHLDGNYTMDLTIDDKVFHDQLTLKGVNRPIYIPYFNDEINGQVIVPNSFTADLTGQVNCSRYFQECTIEFSIIAKENSKEFKVIYKTYVTQKDFFKLLNERTFEGDAFLEDGSLLGHFKVVHNE